MVKRLDIVDELYSDELRSEQHHQSNESVHVQDIQKNLLSKYGGQLVNRQHMNRSFNHGLIS
ncbi:hypothetical protein EXD98_13990 [Acinetobacter pittii]|uniref:Uncharacterized protein n=1 Tax=Acinetobacter pittii TaxID=48296 RepID=A0AAE8G9P6_ACIPI|nr:hypothetical protein [Acinetobacter pittii]RZH26951.1 hypothetical protein EXD98_13990 [Acinetobacter pittii]